MAMSTVRWSTTVMKYAPRMPPAAPSIVTIATSAKRPSVTPSVEPALKPNQPMSRMNMPRPRMYMLWPGIGRGLPSEPYLPLRAPSTSRPASAPVAPTRWTAVEPAKSCMPMFVCSQPPPNTQWEASG